MDGNKLKKFRKDKGLTQSEVAAELGVTAGTISMWETSKRAPNRKNLLSLSQLYEIPIEHLLMAAEFNKRNDPEICDISFEDLPSIIKGLDFYGQKMVFSVIQLERDRCHQSEDSSDNVSFPSRIKIGGV